ncbi:hypothetical protein [Actinophytocola xanthii]|uniref:DUF4878 domain-containing protein n=1 Tax=Actinophytocola xanthii TaxID=1912961 RepID=A0A1Q8CUQ3_9PSEU|nr:hypothetical protein [Actinophytocola xanthii]OLF18091.1 hypothetical protein BU204_08080 [Actinophytocola xanthii]
MSDEEPREESPAEAGGERKRTLMVVVGSVVALAVVGLVVFLLVRPDAEEESADPGVPTISGEAPAQSVSRKAPPSAPVSSDTVAVSVPPPPPPPANPEQAQVRTVVDDAIAAINSQDIGAMARIACDPETTGQPEDLLPGVTAVLAGNPEISGDTATAQVRLSIDGATTTVVPIPLEKRADGTWCVP